MTRPAKQTIKKSFVGQTILKRKTIKFKDVAFRLRTTAGRGGRRGSCPGKGGGGHPGCVDGKRTMTDEKNEIQRHFADKN